MIRLLTAFIPLAFLVMLIALASRRAVYRTEAVLLGAIGWGMLITLFTELLGAARLLTFGALLFVWSATAIVLSVLFWRQRFPARDREGGDRMAGAQRWLVAGVALVLAFTLIVALAAPPNTFDSMVYHMSRVAHWQADRSVSHYPTAILRQLHQTPWASYAILHLQILSDGDRLANLLQWLAMAGSLAGVAAIAGRLGADRRARIAAVVFCATIPMGILQATGTQTDYVVAFWLVCIAWLVLVLHVDHRPLYWLALGGALGLAALTKATAYIFAAPFVIWLLWDVLRARALRPVGWLGVAAVVALMLNAAFYARNVDLYGAPLGPAREDDRFGYVNDRFTPRYFASNVVRNVALHAGTRFDRIALPVTAAVQKVHSVLGVDASDPATTWMAMTFHLPGSWLHEDHAANLVHFVLIILAFGVLSISRRGRSGERLIYMGSLVAGFLLFCAYLKWQPWHSRLHLPLFVLSAPVVGIAIAQVARGRLAVAIPALLVVASFPWLLRNESRRLVGDHSVITTPRTTQYFANWRNLGPAYAEAASLIRASECRNVAVALTWNAYEYPLWQLLREADWATPRLHHVLVRNASARLDSRRAGGEEYCALISVGRESEAAELAASLRFARVTTSGLATLFLPAGGPEKAGPLP